MRLGIAALTLLLCQIALAADDCTFDQDNQIKVLKAVALIEPGAVLELDKRQVLWRRANGDSTIFGYGGCADLGSTVEQSTPMKAPRTKEQVLALARAMAVRYWGNSQVSARLASETLVAGLLSSRFTVEDRNGTTTYSVSDPSYVQLYVEHSFSSGIDRVTIAWQGNF